MSDPRQNLKQYLIGGCAVFDAFAERLARASGSEATVLLSGESGVGKGAAARALHGLGARREGPLVTVDVAALPQLLVESELFGHVRGAFTDAQRDRLGAFRRAEMGTLVLDDVDLLPAPVQVKLLRALQEREVEPVGAEGPVPIDARFVATTHRDLQREVAEGRFREDLYYRLAVVTIEVPPLRARLEDLPVLARAHVSALANAQRGAPRELSEGALERLAEHAWPGNVRELENALERVLVLAGPDAGAIAADEFAFLDEHSAGLADEIAHQALSAGLTVDDVANAMMERAFAEQRGNVSAAARQVGLTRRAYEYRRAQRGEDEPSGAEADPDAADAVDSKRASR